jgi:hypothetical protein
LGNAAQDVVVGRGLPIGRMAKQTGDKGIQQDAVGLPIRLTSID